AARLQPSHAFYFVFHVVAPDAPYTLSLHDALPICFLRSAGWPAASTGGTPPSDFSGRCSHCSSKNRCMPSPTKAPTSAGVMVVRSEEHTSELQSLRHLVCRLLLEKKNDT